MSESSQIVCIGRKLTSQFILNPDQTCAAVDPSPKPIIDFFNSKKPRTLRDAYVFMSRVNKSTMPDTKPVPYDNLFRVIDGIVSDKSLAEESKDINQPQQSAIVKIEPIKPIKPINQVKPSIEQKVDDTKSTGIKRGIKQQKISSTPLQSSPSDRDTSHTQQIQPQSTTTPPQVQNENVDDTVSRKSKRSRTGQMTTTGQMNMTQVTTTNMNVVQMPTTHVSTSEDEKMPESALVCTTGSIFQRYVDRNDIQLCRLIEKYDEVIMAGEEWISKKTLNMKQWSALTTFYTIFHFLGECLGWPLNDSLVISNYRDNTTKFSKIIPTIFEHYNISHHFKDCDNALKFLVWCIYSMNVFGVVRPILFKSIQDSKHFPLEAFFAVRRQHKQITYLGSWPFRATEKEIITCANGGTSIRYVDYLIKKCSKDMTDQMPITRQKILSRIPDWIHKIIK